MNVSVGSSPESRQQIMYYATGVIVAALVFALGYFVYVQPSSAKASLLKARAATLEAQARNASTTYDEASRLSKVQLADLFDLTRAMPDKPLMPDVLVLLGRVAHNSNVEFLSIAPEPTVPLAGYQAIPMQVSVQGNFYDLMEFLYELRHLVDVRQEENGATRLYATGRLFTVNKIVIALVPGNDPNKPALSAKISLDAFVYGSAAPATPSIPSTTSTTTTTTTSGSASAAGATGGTG